MKEGDWSAELYPESNSKFYLDHGNVQFEFFKRPTGRIQKVVIYENGRQIEQGVRKE